MITRRHAMRADFAGLQRLYKWLGGPDIDTNLEAHKIRNKIIEWLLDMRYIRW